MASDIREDLLKFIDNQNTFNMLTNDRFDNLVEQLKLLKEMISEQQKQIDVLNKAALVQDLVDKHL